MAAIAALAAVIWLWTDGRRRSRATDTTTATMVAERTDAALYDVLRVFVRYTLGCTMLIYATSKVIKTQFRDPGLTALSTPLGDLAPNELTWYFMGYSYAYNLFAGMGELVGSLLLFFRRTTTLGALLAIAIMSNVVVMDFVYDIDSVTIWATHLLLMAVLLVLPDVRRLLDVLIWNRPTASVLSVVLAWFLIRDQPVRSLTRVRRVLLPALAAAGVLVALQLWQWNLVWPRA